MDRYAVIGNPVEHSRSPQIHAAFARATGQALQYERLLAPLDGFRATVDEFRAAGGRGLNVTLPFKTEAFEYATNRSPRAQAAGAVNTLKFDGDTVFGDVTDGAGLVADIRYTLGIEIAGRRVLIAGAGGATRGVIPSLVAESPAALVVVNRTLDRALALERHFAGALRAIGYDALGAEPPFDIVVNATSASLAGDLPPIPAALFADLRLAYDMVYSREDTPFVAFARAQGARRVADGLGMLVEQAAESFLVWRGVRPPTADVLAQLRRS